MSMLVSSHRFRSPEELLISSGDGTAIGNLTNNGGLAAAFNGTTSETYANSATSTGTGLQFWIGKTLSAPKVFSRAVAYGPNNQGFVNNLNPSVTMNIRGKNGAAPSGPTDGTIVGTVTFTDTGDESGGRTITSTDLSTAWDHIFLEFSWASTTRNAGVSELVLYEWG